MADGPKDLSGKPPVRLDGVCERVVRRLRRPEAQVEKEGNEAVRLYLELLPLPPLMQKARIQRDPRFANWTLSEILLEACLDAGFNDPQRAIRLAELALDVAEQLDRDDYGDKLVSDQIARGWVSLANAYKICSQFKSANKALRNAELRLRQGTGDPLERAELLRTYGSIRWDEGRTDEALQLVRDATRIYGRARELAKVASCLCNQGVFHVTNGNAAKGIRVSYEALAVNDPASEPRVDLICRHNITLALQRAGEPRKALAYLDRYRDLYLEVGDRIRWLRRTWLEGRILQDLGKLDEAEERYLTVRQGLLHHRLGLDVALLSLDLASLYARQGRFAAVEGLAEEMIPLFDSRERLRETLAAVILRTKAQDHRLLPVLFDGCT